MLNWCKLQCCYGMLWGHVRSMVYAGGYGLINGKFECAHGYVGADTKEGRVCVPYTHAMVEEADKTMGRRIM